MLEAQGLSVGQNGQPLFQGLSLRLAPGAIMGLQGPSGCGKTSLGRVLAGLNRPLAGRVLLDGAPLPAKGRQPVQYLHQSPVLAMNPRWRIARILAEAAPPCPAHLTDFGIHPDWMGRFPHELSGGELQRISLVRALSARPRYLIADEITAPLDPLSQARIWQALTRTSRANGIGILAISHDAALLQRICTPGHDPLTLSP